MTVCSVLCSGQVSADVAHKTTSSIVYSSSQNTKAVADSSGANQYQANPSFATRNQSAVVRNARRLYSRSALSAKENRRTSTRKLHGKQWHSVFHAPRVCRDRPHSIAFSAFDDEEWLDNFLGDYEGSIPSWDAKVVRRFLLEHSSRLSDPQQSRSWAWLDEREYASGSSRDHPDGLDADQLRMALMYEVSHLPI